MNDKLEVYKALASAVSYDPDTGVLKWLPRDGVDSETKRWNSRLSGLECGFIGRKGYRLVGFVYGSKYHSLKAHRLAWLIVHGCLPCGEIDHINRNRADNRIANLRDVHPCINQRNSSMRVDNTSGITGVNWRKKDQKWRAAVCINGKMHHIGLFSCIDKAADAVKEFRAKHGFTDSHGAPAK